MLVRDVRPVRCWSIRPGAAGTVVGIAATIAAAGAAGAAEFVSAAADPSGTCPVGLMRFLAFSATFCSLLVVLVGLSAVALRGWVFPPGEGVRPRLAEKGEPGLLHEQLLGFTGSKACAPKAECASPAMAAKVSVAAEYVHASVLVRAHLEALRREFDREFQPNSKARRTLGLAALPLLKAVQKLRVCDRLEAAAAGSEGIRQLVHDGEELRLTVENLHEALAPSGVVPDGSDPAGAVTRAKRLLETAADQFERLVTEAHTVEGSARRALHSEYAG